MISRLCLEVEKKIKKNYIIKKSPSLPGSKEEGKLMLHIIEYSYLISLISEFFNSPVMELIINLILEFVNSPIMELIHFMLEIFVEIRIGRFIKKAILENIEKTKVKKLKK